MNTVKEINNLKLWINKFLPQLGKLIKIGKFNIGQSNPTYKLEFEKGIYVLRSKPKGKLLRGAHRIDREYRVMSEIYNSTIPVPKMINYCKDLKVIGTEFYIMTFEKGEQETDPIMPTYSIEEKKILYINKVQTLINLANLNLKKNKIENFGKNENYLERQISMWINQYRLSETNKINSMEFLIQNLEKEIPKELDKLPYVLIHGDFRIDNLILDKFNRGRILSILDWELSTVAPPFIDLSYWSVMLRFSNNWPIKGIGFERNNELNKGIPSEKEIFEIYSNALGYDILKFWNFLLAFNCFRFASILQGITKRVFQGNNSGDNAKLIGQQAKPVAVMGEFFMKSHLE